MESKLPTTPTAKQRVCQNHKLDHFAERNDLNQLQRIDHDDLAFDEIIQSPLEEERNSRTQNAKNKALYHKREPNEAIRCTNHLHDSDFLAARIHRQLDGIGDDKQRQHKQN